MDPNKNIVAVTFSMVLVVAYLILSVPFINPYIPKNFITLDDAVALYIDTLASVERGTVKIPLDEGSVSDIRITYETRGKKDRYEIEHDGWYVLVTHQILGKESMKSVSIINSYPTGAGIMERSIFSPENVCIVKEHGKYPEVRKC